MSKYHNKMMADKYHKITHQQNVKMMQLRKQQFNSFKPLNEVVKQPLKESVNVPVKEPEIVKEPESNLGEKNIVRKGKIVTKGKIL